ncbi:GtrA family protein [Paenibacillus oceani]|uniref:GtrA family protein n=1 Tax=Paenibacillus oceani TaxID=2772510 RepID=UPI001CC24CC2|nr:GtrA family protein [Paenibacillus oceani]
MKLTALVDRTFLRFLLVGVLNTIVGLSSIAFFLNVVHAGYWASTFLGNTIGAVVSYFLNKRFTFRSNTSIRSSLWKYFLITFICYGLSYGAGLAGGRLLAAVFPGFSAKLLENLSALFGTGLYTIMNYLGHKIFTFRPSGTVAQRAGESS